MKCSDLKTELFLYADGISASGNTALISHLEACPLCRDAQADAQEICDSLRQMQRPEMPATLRNRLKESIRTERQTEKHSWLPISGGFRELLQMRIMPYGVGVFASVVIGFTFLTMMFSGMLKPVNLPITARTGQTSIMLASNSNPFKDHDSAEISPTEYAQTRLGLASESPSVNPQGALIALTKSLVRGGMKDDEVVVVADVFGNGLAQIAEVVEPSHNSRAVHELQKALESDPAFAAFIPSNIENRPDSVRVVLKFQNVNVRINQKPRKR